MNEFDSDLAQTARSVRRLMRAIAAICGVLVVGVGGWAFSAQFESAVIASGKFIVKSNAQAVQHLEGGTVGAILVSNGDSVKKGQVLVRLDSSQVVTELSILKGRLIDLTVERSRLSAERDGGTDFARPRPPFEMRAERSTFNTAIMLQQTILTAHISAFRSKLSQLDERERQTEEQIQGFKMIRRARMAELEHLNADLVGQQYLDKKRLIRKSVLRKTLREVARTKGDIGDIRSKISSARSKLAETKFRISELRRSEKSKILDQIKLNESQLAEVREKYVAAFDRTNNLEIRAPRSGFVHEIEIFTVGGVIKAGQLLMSIIPQNDMLLVSANIESHEIDQVYIGQPAVVRISAFKQRITPELAAKVVGVSPDEVKDEQTKRTFFSVKVAINATETAKLNGKRLLPGLPAEVFIQGKKRRVITYLTQPLLDQMWRTFREE